MAKKTREMSISLLLDSGEEITEENINAAMGSDDDDHSMAAKNLMSVLKNMEDKSAIPKAIVKLGVLIAAAIGKLASEFSSHSHNIVVNPTPVNIESPVLPLPTPAGGGRKFTMKVNRDQNGNIDTVDIVEE
ncbi:hypothetical protein LCGC14_1357880 [marine sediment metagenome]|uniref:Uncharacterized protein n=1 Tax=marine sediment metagenome TaxID=412755 RepID=A0A0F9K9J9_9ZZZZ